MWERHMYAAGWQGMFMCAALTWFVWNSMQGLKDTMGFNLAALQHMQRRLKSRHASLGDEAQAPVKRLTAPSE